MSRPFFDYLSLIITTIGTILGAVGIYLTVRATTDIAKLVDGLVVWLLISTTLFLFLFLLYLKRSITHSRYTQCYSIISNAFASSHKLRSSDDVKQLASCIVSLQDFCTDISDAFTKISNRSTAVCIKLFHIAENGDVSVKTFCRDNRSRTAKNRIAPSDDDCTHYLSENTDFKYIFENAKREGAIYKSYLSNKLPFEDFYRNTRLSTETYPPKSSIPIIKEIKRYMKWPLPYKSTITVPITPLTDRPIEQSQIVGYLCIDSNFLWAYKAKYDIPILRGIADGLYPTIKKISQIHFAGVDNSLEAN